VLEEDVGVLLGDLQRRLHEAERGREDELMPAPGQALDDALGVGAFRDVLDEGRLDLVAERLLHGLAALVVLVGIAEIADRPDIDEADLQLVLRRGRAAQPEGGQRGSRGHDLESLHLGPLFLAAALSRFGPGERPRRPVGGVICLARRASRERPAPPRHVLSKPI
jgi:hypothetical protein